VPRFARLNQSAKFRKVKTLCPPPLATLPVSKKVFFAFPNFTHADFFLKGKENFLLASALNEQVAGLRFFGQAGKIPGGD